MRELIRSIASLALAGILVGACSVGATPTPSPSPSPAVSPSPAASPSPSPTPRPSPSASPVPSTDGEGAEYVVGVATLEGLTQEYTETQVGDVLQMRDGVLSLVMTMNDPRVTGKVTWQANVDAYESRTIGPGWGTYRIENADGAWEGPFSGATWLSGAGNISSGWLVGSGAYEGYSFYLHFSKVPDRDHVDVQGVIYPGAPPSP